MSDGKVEILLIEDEDLVRHSIKEYAEIMNLPWKFEEATTLREAKEKLEQKKYSFCISDCHLPDGLACELLDSHLKSIPTVIVSGSINAEVTKKAKSNPSIKGIYKKPVRIHDLIQIINKAVRSNQK